MKKCLNHTNPAEKWFIHKGTYKPKTTHKETPRYQWKACKKTFSSHTNKETTYKKRHDISTELFELLVSGVYLRRVSIILKVEYNTVVNRFAYLAEQAQIQHALRLKPIHTSFVQVDERGTFIHACSKCLPVPMAVRVKTGEILGFAMA